MDTGVREVEMRSMQEKIRKISGEDLKMIELELLQIVHNFCEEHNLKYYLWGGTLLGAIRHNGFIPWDDDIDIAIPREDFETLRKYFGDDKYGLSDCESDYRHPYWHAKVYRKDTIKVEPIFYKDGFSLGVDIDIFVLDSYNDYDEMMKSASWRTKQIPRYWRSLCPSGKSGFKARIGGLIYRNILGTDANMIAHRINTVGQSFGHNGNGLMLYADANIKQPLRLEKSWFERSVLHIFEDRYFYIPENYDALLRACYGDYMTPPPVNKRATHHSFEVFYK